ncbi:acyl-CoA dehydratase activase [Thermodesulfobacteriota bacterium]
MLSAGLDIGAQNIKLAILKDDQLLSYSIVPSGWDTEAALKLAFKEALDKSGVDREAIEVVGATGMGKENTSFATAYAADSTCSAKGTLLLIPSARTIIDIGAEQSRVLRCDQTGRVLERVRNDQCAAGAGAFLEEIASRLDIGVEEMNGLSPSSQKEITLNSTCVIFAESEVVSLINEGVNKGDIIQAIVDTVADKAVSLLRCINVEKEIAFIGGVAKNAGVVHSIGKQLGLNIVVPPEPRIVSAAGAALMANQTKVKSDIYNNSASKS